MQRRSASLFGLLVAMLLFGTIGLFVKHIPLSGSFVALVRAVVGFLFLVIVMIIQKRPFSFAAVRNNLLPLSLSGVFLGFNWILLFESYRYTSVAVSTLCYYMAPILVILISPVVLKERLTIRKAICVLLALMGMVLISGALQTGIPAGDELSGILFGLGAAVLYAAIVLLNQKLKNISAYERTVFQLGLSALILIPYCIFTCDFSSVQLAFTPVALLLTVGVVHTGFTYYLYFGSMEHLSGQTVAMLSYVDPVVAVLISVFILQEPMKTWDIPGAVLILGAAVLSEIPTRGRRSK